MPVVTWPDEGEYPWYPELITGLNDVNARADSRAPVNLQTVASYTLDLGDEGLIIEMNSGVQNDLFVPPSATIPFPLGATVYVCQIGVGTTRIRQGSGVTVQCTGRTSPYSLTGQWAEATIRKRGSDEWVLSGNLL